MKAAAIYKPRRDSLAARLLAHLTAINRPMSSEEIVVAFGLASRVAVWQCLMHPVNRGLLLRETTLGVNWYRLPSCASQPVERMSRVRRALRPCPDERGIDPRSCWPFGSVQAAAEVHG